MSLFFVVEKAENLGQTYPYLVAAGRTIPVPDVIFSWLFKWEPNALILGRIFSELESIEEVTFARRTGLSYEFIFRNQLFMAFVVPKAWRALIFLLLAS